MTPESRVPEIGPPGSMRGGESTRGLTIAVGSTSTRGLSAYSNHPMKTPLAPLSALILGLLAGVSVRASNLLPWQGRNCTSTASISRGIIWRRIRAGEFRSDLLWHPDGRRGVSRAGKTIMCARCASGCIAAAPARSVYGSDGTPTGLTSTYFHQLRQLLEPGLAVCAAHQDPALSLDVSLMQQREGPAPIAAVITDTAKTNAYITNVLLPIVARYKNQPNLLGYEVINEPELATTQYGSTDHKVDVAVMQRFVAMIANAIHQNCSLPVTLGSVRMKYCTNMKSSTGDQGINLWNDASLKAAYNATGSHLDFYQVHSPTRCSPTGWCPFDTTGKYPASYFFDKPTLIGEFYGKDDTKIPMTLPTMLNTGLAGGYIGHMTWNYTTNWSTSQAALNAFGSANTDIVDCLLSDDFEDGDAAGWNATGTWSVISDGSKVYTNSVTGGFSQRGNPSWTNYSAAVDIKPTALSGGSVSLSARCRAPARATATSR